MQDSAEVTNKHTDFDEEIKKLHITLKDATISLLRHLLCNLDQDRFVLIKGIMEMTDKLKNEARQIQDPEEKTRILQKLDEFSRNSSALMVTLNGLVKQAEVPRARFQKLLATIKEL